ncbi:MAG TPA: RHS repeat-associated core domain-containing protein [Candidatus Angelobacter sp.]
MFAYDSLSRLRWASNPESGIISYTYDNDGNLWQKTSPAPNQTGSATQTISYCYDELHRITGKAYGALNCPLTSPVVSYAYDSGANAKGHLTSMTDQAGTATYAFDILGRMTSETRTIAGIGKTTSYTYQLGGLTKTLTYPSGRVVTYTPDSAGRLLSAVDGNGAQYVSNATYYANGAEYQRSMPGIYFSTTLNPRLQVSHYYSDNGQTSSFFIDKTYSYGPLHQNNGNVMSITNNKDGNRTQTFAYDALDRLISGWSSANTGNYSWGENYSIDAWGNLQITPMSGKAHGGNFTLSSTAVNQPTGLGFDAAGNLLAYGSASYTYDPEERLLSTAGMTYTYDGNGERVLKSQTVGGAAVKRYWSMGGNTLAEADGSGNLTAEYIYFGAERIARIDLPANTVHYYLSDHLNSTSIVVSAAGAVEEESDYYPFGTEMIVTGPGTNELKFTGKRRDTESQLDYFGARYYSKAFGRFLTPDWAAKATAVPYAEFADPQSLNLYTYVRNLPTTKVDADGHCAGDGCSDMSVNVQVTSKPAFRINEGPVDGKYETGIHGQLTITIKQNGKEVANVPVSEKITAHSTRNGEPSKGNIVVQKNPQPTDAGGKVSDDVSMQLGTKKPSSPALADAVKKDQMDNGYVVTSTQTVTFPGPNGATCSATYSRTLSNTNSNGNLNKTNDPSGSNYTLSVSTNDPKVKEKK